MAAGVQNVAVDRVDENAPVEYFNLQGIRVANPEAGQLLIKKQGARMVRNPQTGEEFKKPACKVAKFRLAKVAKDALVPPKVKK